MSEQKYTVRPGDTFADIARRKYGNEADAARLARANPGVVDPLPAGLVLAVPMSPDTPAALPIYTPANGADEVAVVINGARFRFWDRISITDTLDQMATVEFGAPFDHEIPGFREAFRPFSYAPITVTAGGSPLFTGTMVAVTPTVDSRSRLVEVSGYATPGVLNDCSPPASAFPLEFNGLTLADIATAIAEPFGVLVEVDGDPGPPFERVACEPDTTALAFLAELAKQRNRVLTSTPTGALKIWQSAEASAPVARLRQGESPMVAVAPTFNPQQYYSHITGLEPVHVGDAGSQYTVKNPHLEGVTRPHSFTVQDAEGGDVKAAVEAKAGRMFADMASYSVRVATWRDPAGQLWRPNSTVSLLAPDAMVYTETRLLVRSVTFERERAATAATLDLILPGAFSGKLPEALPWAV